jgi:dynein light chain roadblock-type
MKRIIDHPGVTGLIIMQEKRQPVYTTMDNNKTFLFANRLSDFAEIAEHTIKSVYPEDELMVIRIKTNKYEIMNMLPTKTQSIIVVQQQSKNK